MLDAAVVSCSSPARNVQQHYRNRLTVRATLIIRGVDKPSDMYMYAAFCCAVPCVCVCSPHTYAAT